MEVISSSLITPTISFVKDTESFEFIPVRKSELILIVERAVSSVG